MRSDHYSYEIFCATKAMVDRMEHLEKDDSTSCQACLICKATRTPRSEITGLDQKTGESLKLVQSDVCGQINPASLGGAHYFVTLYDEYSAVSAISSMP